MSEQQMDLTGTDEAGNIVYNQKKKQEKLMRQATRAHEWRVQVWAQQEQRIAQINAQLKLLGVPEFVPFDPDFADAEQVQHYATMKLTK